MSADFINHLHELAHDQLGIQADARAISTARGEEARSRMLDRHRAAVRRRLETFAYLLAEEGVTYGAWEFTDGADMTEDLAAAIRNDADFSGLNVARRRIDGLPALVLTFK